MRIGYDAKRLFCNFTGLGNYSRALLHNLGNYYPENAYFLYTPKLKKTKESQAFLQNPLYHAFVSKARFNSFWRSYSIINQLIKDKIDLYHGLSHEIPLTIHKSNIKSIVSIHDLIFKIYPYTYPFIDRAFYNFKFRYSCKNSDRVIAVSKSTKKDIVKFYDIDSSKIDVVYPSCAPLYFDNNEDNSIFEQEKIPKNYLLYVGSVEQRKNLKTIIKSYSFLSDDYKIPLVVVGKGKKYKEEVKKMIKNEGLDNLVIWFKRLSNNYHLKALYKNALALIYPSLYEGFGLPVAEALLCKTPVITSNVSSLPEAGGPDSLYIYPTNAEQLAAAIEKVLSDTALRKKMTRKGYLYAMENFTGKKNAENTIKSYNKTLNNN